MPMTIKQRLDALKRELRAAGIRDARVTPFPALPARTRESLARKHDVRLPDAIGAYYAQANGQHVSWSRPESDLEGWSTISDLASFLAGRVSGYVNGESRTDAPFYSKRLDPARQRELDGYFVLDRAYADTFVVLPRPVEGEAPVLFLFEYPDQLSRLALSFDEYLDALFESRAQLDWQRTHVEGGGPAPTAATTTSPDAGAYRERLDDLAKRIRENRRLELVRLDRYPPAPPPAFRKIAATFGNALPAAMVDFYSTLNGFRLLWRTRPDVAPVASGVIDIPPLERAFGGEHHRLTVDWDDHVTRGELWTDELAEASPDDVVALRGKRQLDRHTGRNQILMEVTPGGVALFSYVDGGVAPLDAGFEDALDLAFRTAGVDYYPELLGRPDAAFREALVEQIRLVNPDFER
jgi:hypothetical protein